MNEFGWIIGMFLLFGLIWFAGGGPARGPGSGLFLNQQVSGVPTERNDAPESPASAKNAQKQRTKEEIARELERIREEVRKVEEAIARLEEEERSSPFRGAMRLEVAHARADLAAREYLELRYSRDAKTSAPITGWTLVSPITGRSIVIGEAARIPLLGRVNVAAPIALAAGESAYILTGRSPNGISFLPNICTGYFEQFQNFTPSLRRECPRITDEPLPPSHRPEARGYGASSLEDACLDYIERVGECTVPVSIPPTLSSACQEFVVKTANYDTCVERHRTDENFFKDDWRLYLSRDEELWKEKREVIELRDAENKLVDVVVY